MNGIVAPNGQPAQREVRVESDQALATAMKLIEAQVESLLTTFKMPPPVIAEYLTRFVAALVAPVQSDFARRMLVDSLVNVLRSETERRAAELALRGGILAADRGR